MFVAVTMESAVFMGGQGDGVPKASAEQAAADSRGSRTCVFANTCLLRGGTCTGRRMN